MNIQLQKCSYFPILFIVLLSSFPATANEPSIPAFCEDRIDAAITGRNQVLRALLPESADIAIPSWSPALQSKVETTINNSSEPFVPWPSFIIGMLRYLQQNPASDSLFARSLAAAADDPGITWLLFVEFDRYDLEQWIERSLSQLEKQMFMAGGSSSTIISRQLIHYGFVNKIKRNNKKALYYFTWAHRFNPDEIRSIVQRAVITSPLNFFSMVTTGFESVQVLRTSWRAQLSFFSSVYSFLRRFLLVFIIIIAVIFSIKYFPRALHHLAHLYPADVPLWLRTLLASGIVVSLVAFGIIPFLLLLACLFWRHLAGTERLLFGVVIGGIIFAPVDNAILDRFNHTVDPRGPIMRLSQSLNEGYFPRTAPVSQAIRRDGKGNLPLDLSAALRASKSNDLVQAAYFVDGLAHSHPSDPVVANTRGIIHFLNGSIDSATSCFEEVVKSHPADITARFNLSRCIGASNNASTGMELLKNASDLAPQLINRFVRDNDRYFSGQWPPLRQVLFPDYSPFRFWKTIFFPFTDNKDTRRSLWGLSFLGIPPLPSFVILLFFLALLLALQQVNRGKKKLRRLFECKYCGRTICRKCTTGVICMSCAGATQMMEGPTTREQTREKIMKTFDNLVALRNNFLNVFLPGSGLLLAPHPRYCYATIICATASVLYAWWYTMFTGSVFSGMTQAEIFSLLLFPCLFQGYFIIRYFPKCIHHFNALVRLQFLKEGSSGGTQRNPA